MYGFYKRVYYNNYDYCSDVVYCCIWKLLGLVVTKLMYPFPAGVEEEYQSSAKKREEKENFFNDVRAELSSLIAEVERQQEKLRHLNEREEEAKIVTSSHPERISRLKEKIDSTLHLLMPETDDDKAMDCSQ